MRNIISILLLVSIFVCASIVRADVPKVEFKNDKLYVNDKPFFIYGCWGILPEAKEHHLTAQFFHKDNNMEELAKDDLMWIPYILTPQSVIRRSLLDNDPNLWFKRPLGAFSHDAPILAWFCGDDLTGEHKNIVDGVVPLLRKHDGDMPRPIMLDTWDSHQKYGETFEMIGSYRYPLMHERDLRSYRDWLMERHAKNRPDSYFWTVCQAHMQFWYLRVVSQWEKNQPLPPLAEPDAEQVRLVTYAALSSGARGLLQYFPLTLSNKMLGADRRAEIGLLGCELEILGEFLAGGELPVIISTSDPNVDASFIRYGDKSVMLLADYAIENGNVVGGKSRQQVEVKLPFNSEKYEAVELNFAEPKSLPLKSFGSNAFLTIPEFDLTSAIIFVPKGGSSQIKSQIVRFLPDAAKFACRSFAAKLEKIESTQLKLVKLHKTTAEEDKLLNSAQKQNSEAQTYFAKQDSAEAFIAARTGMGALRKLQTIAWNRARNGLHPSSGNYLMSYYQLPKHYALQARIENGQFSKNLLVNGSFESGDEGWKLSSEKAEVVSRQKTQGFPDGAKILRLERGGSASSMIFPVPADAIVRLTGWIKIPLKEPIPIQHDFQIKLLWGAKGSPAGAELRKKVGWRVDLLPCDWEPFSMTYELQKETPGEVAVQFSMRGAEVYLDGINLAVWQDKNMVENTD